MRLDQLNGLLALKIVADTRNFTVAAQRLGVSPSAVSQTIKQLEQRLGVALLARTTRSTSLTEAGDKFLSQAGPALDQVLVAMGEMGSYAQKPSGLLRLNLPRQVYPFYIAPLITNFIKEHPEITVELFFEDEQSDVVGEGFDAGIRLSDILAQDVAAIKLMGPVTFVVAASPNYLDLAGRPKRPEDLLMHGCICPRFGSGPYDRWEFEDNGEDISVHVKPSLIMNNSLLMLEAAVSGAGIVYTTENAIQNKVRSGELEIVLKPFACRSSGYYLYYPDRSQVLPKLRAFIDYVKLHKTKVPTDTQ
ncbi:LysR family transcriptional regulator [Asticcacaulis sp. ZE23SCel15]|uniref:LysR family transcriptional regulator n=1 Tax=Asticcacaulis sp. ZE23SCel15 TaxID=3059027 RepID=UPI00265E76EF|nr:LysR family transcriptional regulator [Asticcacaulis sp. ZE23SCel15]WKL56706.1 LysR family transcriptional regulator [Asticcacaulis sp. ZE23SCel15]